MKAKRVKQLGNKRYYKCPYCLTTMRARARIMHRRSIMHRKNVKLVEVKWR